MRDREKAKASMITESMHVESNYWHDKPFLHLGLQKCPDYGGGYTAPRELPPHAPFLLHVYSYVKSHATVGTSRPRLQVYS